MEDGTALFRRFMEEDWQGLVRLLKTLPPWFRVQQFLTTLGAMSYADWRVVRVPKKTRNSEGFGRYTGKVDNECLDSLGQLWYESLDPADKAALEQYAGIYDEPPESKTQEPDPKAKRGGAGVWPGYVRPSRHPAAPKPAVEGSRG